jgi:acyl carrier protein
VPLGGPLADHRLHVLEESPAPAPAGVPGELHIGGPGLARGYFGDPAQTAQRFIPDPFGGAGERLYRTGDLVRRLPDGTLDFLGRIDHQVKLRGFRIELGEIEALLARQVQEAAVLLRQDLPGGPGLVAYVVGDGGESHLRSWLHDRLPAYMVPSTFLFLDSLPKTANGKLDGAALATLPLERTERIQPVDAGAPRTLVEELVAGIFAEALDLDRVGVSENFFELGGHSLLATQVVSRVRSLFGVELPLRTVFEAPAAADLSRRIESELNSEAGASCRRSDPCRPTSGGRACCPSPLLSSASGLSPGSIAEPRCTMSHWPSSSAERWRSAR